MEIKLQEMKIRNFKGIKSLDISFDGNTEIHGDNGTGKTSIKDAFNWLLFGKNSEGKTDFGIKPVDENGDVIHRLETSVEATFMVDGYPKNFKKTMKESWTRKRGAATETFSGHENNFFVNTVPKKKTEYTAEISSLINEDLFKMLTDPLHFNEINWKNRRSILLDVCGDISDEDVFRRNPDLLPLKAELNGLTTDEFKSVISRDMKAINKELSVIPSQINEAELAKPTSTGAVDVKKKQELLRQIEQCNVRLNELRNGVEIVKLKSDRRDLERQLASVKAPTISDTLAYAEIKEKTYSKAETEKEVLRLEFQKDRLEAKFKDVADRKVKLSKEWDSVFEKTFFGDTCPTCGQTLPEDVLEEKKKTFNRKKAKELDRIEQELTSFKKEELDLRFSKSEIDAHINSHKATLETIESQLAELKEKSEEELKILESQADSTKAKFTEEISAIDEKITHYDSHVKAEFLALNERLTGYNTELHAITVIEAGIEMEKRQDKRIQELMDRQVELSRAYMDKERNLALAEQFVIAKVQMLSEKVNKHFRYAKFNLFSQNINGGIEEACEVTYNGVPYKDLNTASRINIGLDIIDTLSWKYSTNAPIFIDGAESVTKFIPTESQKILLVVDKNFKELNVKKEN